MTRPLLALLAALLLASAAPKPADEPKPFALTGAPVESVTLRIEAEDGGVIEAVSAAGDRFRLTIPADALYHDATITLTPLTGARLDGAERTLAVKMAPAGLQFFDPATLTIEPATPLGEEVWWFESLEGRSGALRPGLVAKGGTGLLVWHFSEGAVASGPGVTRAVEMRGVSDAPGSSSWLEWQRNVTQQNYESGKIDKVSYDTRMEIINERLAELASRQIREELQRASEATARKLREAAETAEKGDLKDIERLGDPIDYALRVARQCALLGVQDCDLSAEAMDVMLNYRARLRERCDEKPYGSDRRSMIDMLKLERMAQLFGAGAGSGDDAGSADLSACLFREWNARVVAFPGQSEFETTVTLKRQTCTYGVYGTYEYVSTGGYKANFTVALGPPNDRGRIPFTPISVQSQINISTGRTACSVTCEEPLEAGVVRTGDRATFFLQKTTPGRCERQCGPLEYKGDTLAVSQIDLKPGPLCDPAGG